MGAPWKSGLAEATTTIEGRERYSVNLRYPRELRENLQQLGRVLVPTKAGAHVPMAELADEWAFTAANTGVTTKVTP